MPDEECSMNNPQGKQPLKEFCLWQNDFFLFISEVKYWFAVPLLVASNMRFQGHVYL